MKTPTTARDISEALYRTIQRDPNHRATVRHALPSEDHRALLVDVSDETGANGMRTFVVKVHEVDPPEGHDAAEVVRLAALITASGAKGPERDEPLSFSLARHLLDAGVTL